MRKAMCMWQPAEIDVFTPKGEKLGMIDVAEKPSNSCSAMATCNRSMSRRAQRSIESNSTPKGVALY